MFSTISNRVRLWLLREMIYVQWVRASIHYTCYYYRAKRSSRPTRLYERIDKAGASNKERIKTEESSRVPTVYHQIPFPELIISNINHSSPAMREANGSPPVNRLDPHIEAMPRLGRDTPFYV